MIRVRTRRAVTVETDRRLDRPCRPRCQFAGIACASAITDAGPMISVHLEDMVDKGHANRTGPKDLDLARAAAQRPADQVVGEMWSRGAGCHCDAGFPLSGVHRRLRHSLGVQGTGSPQEVNR